MHTDVILYWANCPHKEYIKYDFGAPLKERKIKFKQIV